MRGGFVIAAGLDWVLGELGPRGEAQCVAGITELIVSKRLPHRNAAGRRTLRATWLVSCATLLAGFTAQRAVGLPLTLVADHRSISAQACPSNEEIPPDPACNPDYRSPPVPFAPFDDTATVQRATASQNTTVSVDAMNGSIGSSVVPAEPADGYALANSDFHILFDADVTVPYTWSGTASGYQGLKNAHLYDVTTSTYVFRYSVPGGTVNPFETFSSGLLTGGHRYELFIETGAFGYQESASWDFTFVVPEPSTISLVALGLLSMSLRTRRRARITTHSKATTRI